MEPVFFIAGIAALMGVVLGLSRAFHAHQLRELERLAVLLHGNVRADTGWFASLDGARVDGTYERQRVTIRYEIRGSGKNKRTYVNLRVHVDEPISGFRIRNAGVINRLGRWLGLVRDIKTGNERIDATFILDGRPEALAGLFAHREAERHLKALFGKRASEVELRGKSLSTSFRVTGVDRAKVAGAAMNLASLAKLCDRKPIEVRVKDQPVVKRFGWTGGTDHVMCPYCRDGIESPEALEISACSSCQTLHHTECLQEAGGCTVFGCGGGRTSRQRVR